MISATQLSHTLNVKIGSFRVLLLGNEVALVEVSAQRRSGAAL